MEQDFIHCFHVSVLEAARNQLPAFPAPTGTSDQGADDLGDTRTNATEEIKFPSHARDDETLFGVFSVFWSVVRVKREGTAIVSVKCMSHHCGAGALKCGHALAVKRTVSHAEAGSSTPTTLEEAALKEKKRQQRLCGLLYHQESGEMRANCISSRQIPEDLEAQDVRDKMTSLARLCSADVIVLSDDGQSCSCSGELKLFEQVPANPKHILPNLLFLATTIHVVQVWSTKCASCSNIFPFDGNALGILNVDNHALFSWQRLGMYWTDRHLNQASYHGHLGSWLQSLFCGPKLGIEGLDLTRTNLSLHQFLADNYLSLFQAACVCLEVLQKLNYESDFMCKPTLTADGVVADECKQCKIVLDGVQVTTSAVAFAQPGFEGLELSDLLASERHAQSESKVLSASFPDSVLVPDQEVSLICCVLFFALNAVLFGLCL